jgi:hypothetical protein
MPILSPGWLAHSPLAVHIPTLCGMVQLPAIPVAHQIQVHHGSIYENSILIFGVSIGMVHQVLVYNA